MDPRQRSTPLATRCAVLANEDPARGREAVDAVDGASPSECEGVAASLPECHQPDQARVLSHDAPRGVEPQDPMPARLAPIERRPQEGAPLPRGTAAGRSLEAQDADRQESMIERQHDPLGPVEGQPAHPARGGPRRESRRERVPPPQGCGGSSDPAGEEGAAGVEAGPGEEAPGDAVPVARRRGGAAHAPRTHARGLGCAPSSRTSPAVLGPRRPGARSTLPDPAQPRELAPGKRPPGSMNARALLSREARPRGAASRT